MSRPRCTRFAHLAGNGMPLTRGSVRCKGGFEPPKIAAPLAPGACTKISAPGPSCGAQPVSVSLISFSSTACVPAVKCQDHDSSIRRNWKQLAVRCSISIGDLRGSLPGAACLRRRTSLYRLIWDPADLANLPVLSCVDCRPPAFALHRGTMTPGF